MEKCGREVENIDSNNTVLLIETVPSGRCNADLIDVSEEPQKNVKFHSKIFDEMR